MTLRYHADVCAHFLRCRSH